MKIFVSYSRTDAGDFAKHIYRFMGNKGYDVFIDVNSITIGDRWANSIEKNISECDMFLVILTPDSLTSSHVENEVLQAQKENKIIVPCIHEHVEYNDIKWDLQKVQGIEFLDKYDLARTLPLKITTSLSENILKKPGNIPTIREEGTKKTKSILKELENNHNNTMDNFYKIRSDIVKFDLGIPADRLLFYLRLLEYLTNSNEVFLNQNRIQYMLADSLRKKNYHILRNIGYDEHFYNVHSKMNDEEREMFNFLRRTTEDSKLLNTFARRLLQDNLEIFTEISELKLLYEHYCYWLAKYELLKNDPDMCLVYVGPKQKKRFPIGIESLINEKIKALRKETLMQNLP